VKTINGEAQLHALVDGTKIIVTEASIRRDLHLSDEEEVNFSKLIFESMIKNLDNVSGKFLMYPRFVQVFLEQQLEDMSTHKRIYVAPSHTKKVFANMRRVGKDFSGSAIPTDLQHTPTITQPSTSQPQKTQKPRKPKRKNTEVPQPSGSIDNVVDEVVHKELGDSLVRTATTASSLEAEEDSGNITKTRSKATPNESSSQGADSGGGPMCQETMGDTIAQTRVLDLENTKTTQQKEIAKLKRSVKKLEWENRSRTHRMKRLHKVGMSRRVVLSNDEESLGEDASKQWRNDADAEMFDVGTLTGDEVFAKQEVTAKDVNLTIDEVNLALALAALKSAKPKVKGDVIEEPSVPVSAASTKVSAANASTKVSTATTTTATIPTPRKGIVITEQVTPTIRGEHMYDIKEWNIRCSTECHKRRDEILARLRDWDAKAEAGIVTPIDINRREDDRMEIQKNDHLERRIMKQKARIKWAVEGDETSHFFHNYVKKKARKNNIKGLVSNGEWVRNPMSIKDIAFNHFSARFKESCQSRPVFDSNLFRMLNEVDANFLEAEFSKEEIKAAVWDCSGSKAPGPVGVWALESMEALDNRLDFFGFRFYSNQGYPLVSLHEEAVLDNGIRFPHSFFLIVVEALQVIDCLERIRSRFFWGFKEGENSLVWVKWKAILADWDRGGLGIGSIKPKNIFFESVGAGLRKTCGKDRFPRFYALETNKDASLSERWCCFNGVWAGLWSWRINPRGRSESDLELLISYLQGVELRVGVEDRLLWSLDQHHSFSVKKLTSLIDFNILQDHCFGSKSHTWNSLVPKKVNIHIWRLAKDRLPLLPKLLRLGINVVSVMCPLCGEVPESIDHIMVHCPKVKPIWMKCFSWWDLKPPPGDLSVKSLIDGIFCTHLPKIAQSVFVGVCYSAFWAIWRWRNKVWHASDEDKDMELGVVVDHTSEF
ncbi:ribonuclease H-like domain-containing protein, partial [Tanacetum coccineum]